MGTRINKASEESKWIIRNYFEVVAYYKALADSRNLEIDKMVNALEDTRVNWLADRKNLQAEVENLKAEVEQSSSELKENINQRLSNVAELDEIKRRLKDALEENGRLKTENDRLKSEHAPGPSEATDGEGTQQEGDILFDDQEDEEDYFYSPHTAPVQPMPLRAERKKRRSSAAFVRRSSSLPARNEVSRDGIGDEGEDDDCYHTSIKRIKCSQNLHNVDMNDAGSERCFNAHNTPNQRPYVSYDERPHCFGKRRNFYRINCSVCTMSIGFSSMFVKCSRCKCVLHEHCRLKVASPCLTWVIPPKAADGKGMRLRLGDFCPNERPMVPPLIAYCVYFLSKGNSPHDLYDNPGSQFEIEAIEKMFKSPTNSIKLDTFSKVSVAACVKKFLGEIRDPLIPTSYAKEFVHASSLESFPKLVKDLPTAHMDALACLCRHWRLYVESGVTMSNLSVESFCERIACVVFGVRDCGASTHNTTGNLVGHADLNAETAFKVLKNLLEFPADFWTDLLNNNHSGESSRTNTPILRNPSGRSTISVKTTSSSSRYPNINFEKTDS